jgi:type IV fimbrial biogenesis protein FimT
VLEGLKMHSGRRGHILGFTLIEMMTVITLMAIVLSIGVPSFRSFILGQRVKTAAFAFVASAVEARSEAIKRNADVSLAAVSGDWAKGWSTQVGATVINRQDAYEGVVFASPPGKTKPTTVTYQSSGRLGGAVDDLQISDGAGTNSRCVSFDLSGMPKSRMGNC